MSPRERALDSIKTQIDTIVRDEAYDGAFGPLSEDVFNNMAARIASQVMEIMEPLL